MGCLKSKPVSEVPKNAISLVETLYTANAEAKLKEINSSFNEILPKTTPNTTPHPTYRGKFDKRVMAKYDVKALIGKGAHSKVVRVENRVTKQPYAIKIIDRTKAGEMCESELGVLRRVRHENIIRLVEVFESESKLYLVVELATGGELFERIVSKVCFSESDSVKTLKMILEGVTYLHSLAIAHRDLKPENLLYYHPGNNSRLLITDFGLSASQATSPFLTTCGTPEYIAPEVLAKQPYNIQVDMWAMGVITYILLSGNMPFDDDNRTRMYRLILKANFYYDYDHWKDISQAAKDFIDSLLIVDPSKRLSASQALKHPWLTNPSPTYPSTHYPCPTNPSLSHTSSKDLSGNHHGASSASSSSSHPHHHSHGTKGDSDKSSARSSRSGRSLKSLRSDHRHHQRRVAAEEINRLQDDPEVQAELSSLTSWGNAKSTSSNIYY